MDHPHHVGLWFNHGDVNGLDFWNNSDAIPADRKDKMGTIVHQKIVDAKSGAGQGELTVESEWHKPDGSTLLRERTRFVFRADGTSRTIDRITTLTALGERVVFNDNKEGVIGMRVTRALEQPATQPDVFTDASGKASATKVLDNTGVTGQYTSSEGLKGDAVWGTRGRWTMLTGTVESEPVTLVDARPSGESRLPHLLARPRLRSLRRQPDGREGLHGGQEGAQRHDRAGRVDRVPPSHPDPERPGRQPTRSSGSIAPSRVRKRYSRYEM